MYVFLQQQRHSSVLQMLFDDLLMLDAANNAERKTQINNELTTSPSQACHTQPTPNDWLKFG